VLGRPFLSSPPILTMTVFFLVCTGSHWPRAMTNENSLMSWYGLSHESADLWQQGQLGDVLRAKTLVNRKYGMLKGPINFPLGI